MTFVMECSRGMFIASLCVMVQHSGGDTVLNALLVSLFKCVSAPYPSLLIYCCLSMMCLSLLLVSHVKSMSFCMAFVAFASSLMIWLISVHCTHRDG